MSAEANIQVEDRVKAEDLLYAHMFHGGEGKIKAIALGIAIPGCAAGTAAPRAPAPQIPYTELKSGQDEADDLDALEQELLASERDLDAQLTRQDRFASPPPHRRRPPLPLRYTVCRKAPIPGASSSSSPC